jgi:hypothetical protein
LDHAEEFAMRRMPNDTITVTISADNQTTSVFGDPGLPIGAWGGNDTLTATILGAFNSVVNLVGEDTTMHRNSHGGNDNLAFESDSSSFGSEGFLWGDASVAMYDSSRGGNDSLVATLNSVGQAVLVGDAQSMFDNAKGGNDTLYTASTGIFEAGTSSLYGDAGSNMSDQAKGGDDTLTALNGPRFSSAVLSGDAGGSMTDGANGGNDTLGVTSVRFSSAILSGDAGSNMSDHAKGGDDKLTVVNEDSTAVLSGDAGNSITGSAQGGNDTLSVIDKFEFASARLYGDAVDSITDNGHGGDDSLTLTVSDGFTLAASLIGDAGSSMTDNAHGGDDDLTIIVEEGSGISFGATLVGDAPSMSGSAHGGNDVLKAGSSDDSLFGDAQSYAPSAPGSITGGKDVVNGGAGNDQLSGGPNNDTFVFNLGSGNDAITDFNKGNLAVGSTAQEHDLINVVDYGFTSWAALSSLISDDGQGNAVLHLTGTDTVTLEGVHTAALYATDFIIA